jgi:hypothetical protein
VLVSQRLKFSLVFREKFPSFREATPKQCYGFLSQFSAIGIGRGDSTLHTPDHFLVLGIGAIHLEIVGSVIVSLGDCPLYGEGLIESVWGQQAHERRH